MGGGGGGGRAREVRGASEGGLGEGVDDNKAQGNERTRPSFISVTR